MTNTVPESGSTTAPPLTDIFTFFSTSLLEPTVQTNECEDQNNRLSIASKSPRLVPHSSLDKVKHEERKTID